MSITKTTEYLRLKEPKVRLWGPYVSARQWGTVREDYSSDGSAWDYFPHDHARSRAYRWGEDGIGGISDEKQRLCFAVALWNEKDPILKERFFGLTGSEGNHGEDCKELYYHLDNTPSHSYQKMLYKYPQAEYPYARLVEENRRRGKHDPEFEILDTGVFDNNRYFDVFVEYAKVEAEDILIRITAHNRGDQTSPLHILPQLWFRNTWSWKGKARPTLGPSRQARGIVADHESLGRYHLYIDGDVPCLFCENDTNTVRLYGANGAHRYYKDGINDYVVNKKHTAINPDEAGTKAAVHYVTSIPKAGSVSIRLRLTNKVARDPFKNFDAEFNARIKEANAFYEELQHDITDEDERRVQRQALAGLLWSKQFYYFNVHDWLNGDPVPPPPPNSRKHGRNKQWSHIECKDIISMPDTWEYPWFAAWDLAFHCIPFSMIDPDFAKHQLSLLTHEWYMHPNGQLPAYEWAFGDVNPPVHAWAAWRVYKIDQKLTGKADYPFLEGIFHKMLLNFTWWVNRKDEDGHNIFQGGFLGLDNIGVFDRSAELPAGGHLEQADGTAWMGMYCLNMMRIALELALENPVYEELATKFFEHFLYIAKAMMNLGEEGIRMWDDEDEFYYDVMHLENMGHFPLRVRSLVGLIPLFAVEVLDTELLNRVPEFTKRLNWFLDHRPDLATLVSRWHEPGMGERHLLSLLRGHRMKRLFARMLDPNEFLSDYGIRALSKVHQNHPYQLQLDGMNFSVSYQPGESDSGLFGGNSNWRGPIWFPVNYLLIESLQRFHHYYGDDFKVEYPTGSGESHTIDDIAHELSMRLAKIFLRTKDGKRPVFGTYKQLNEDPHFRDYLQFYEYFHGDSGRGVGATHQTGWTALIAKLLQPRSQKKVDVGVTPAKGKRQRAQVTVNP